MFCTTNARPRTVERASPSASRATWNTKLASSWSSGTAPVLNAAPVAPSVDVVSDTAYGSPPAEALPCVLTHVEPSMYGGRLDGDKDDVGVDVMLGVDVPVDDVELLAVLLAVGVRDDVLEEVEDLLAVLLAVEERDGSGSPLSPTAVTQPVMLATRGREE